MPIHFSRGWRLLWKDIIRDSRCAKLEMKGLNLPNVHQPSTLPPLKRHSAWNVQFPGEEFLPGVKDYKSRESPISEGSALMT